MGLFNRNPNEVAFVGEKKHWVDVIKNSGPGELLIWRQPEEDFNTNSTLIVMPGEEAIFIHNGSVEKVFESGSYKLSSENYPFIGRLRNAFSGGVSIFNCVVYFVRSAESMEILWGTDSPIDVRDKAWGILTTAQVRGSYRVKITNPVLFLEKLIGNNIPFETQQELNDYFYNQFISDIKSKVSQTLNSINTELIGLNSKLGEISENIEPDIDKTLKEYGLKCVKFVVSAIDIDTSKYNHMDQGQMESIMKMQLARGNKGVMEILGNDWGKQQAADILGSLANNPGAGSVAAAGAGMGMGIAAGGAFGSLAQQMFTPMNGDQKSFQRPVVQDNVDRFALKDDTTVKEPAENDIKSRLKQLKEYFDEGLINEEEYKEMKKEVLDRMK